MKLQAELEDAVRVDVFYSDFDGDIEQWKDAFYQVWRYQLTWNFAYSIQLMETRRAGVCMCIYSRKDFRDNVTELLTSLGCRNINEEDVSAITIDSYGFSDVEPPIECVFLD